MAVNSITFGGVNSADFGIYISGEGVFNAPKRDVEMITIPGRNGAFALDNGRFENIEVTYPAFNFEPDDYDTFMQNLSDFRNAICAQRGYQRLTDTFHPDEYRMATYIGGLEIKPVKYNTASEFNIVFDCKPQRWLKDGETAITMASGDTLTNPTLFESSPLLETAGSGSIQFNGYEIEFEGVPYGEVEIRPTTTGAASNDNPFTRTYTLDTSLLNTGDPIYPEAKGCWIRCRLEMADSSKRFNGVFVESATNVLDAYSQYNDQRNIATLYLYPDFGDGFVYGTAATITCSAEYRYTVPGYNRNELIQVTIDYAGADTYTITVSRSGSLPSRVIRGYNLITAPTMYGNSSKPITDPISIDCDLGEAYTNENGVYRSLNQYIDLGSELPKLASGSNTITFDNTITELKVQPRWWKV